MPIDFQEGVRRDGPGVDGLTAEQVRDTVAAFLRQGANVTIVHDDQNNTLTISASGVGGGLTVEQVQDAVAAFLRAAAGSPLTLTYDDDADLLTIGIRELTDSTPGIVRPVTETEAETPAGTDFRAWSQQRITQLIAAWRTLVPEAEAIAGEANTPNFWSALRVRQAINAVVKPATAAVRGIVQLARDEDVDATETDTSRVATIDKIKRLIARVGFSGAYADLTGRPSIPDSFDDLTGTVADNQVPPTITRDTEIADLLNSLGISGMLLEATRHGGANPIELALPIGNGLGLVGFWGGPAAAVNNGNFIATGIMLPAAPADSAVFFAGAHWGGSATIGPASAWLTGAQLKALPVVAAGASSGGRLIGADGVSGTGVFAGKLASGELMLRNDEGHWGATDFFAFYEVARQAPQEGDLEGGYLWFTQYNALTTPAFSLTPIDGTNTEILASAVNGRESTLFTGRTPPLTFDVPLAVDYEGALLVDNDTGGGRQVLQVEIGYQVFPGVPAKQFTQWRRVIYQTQNGQEISIPADVFSHTSLLTRGIPLPLDGGGTYTLTDADLKAGLPVKILLRLKGYNQNNISQRQTYDVSHLEWLQPQVVSYQIGLRDTEPQPYITDFSLTGDLTPPAGDIGGMHYDFATGVAHSDEVAAARIIGFAGATPSGAVVVLRTLTAAEYHAAEGRLTLPGVINLAADAFYTVRLEIYTAGQTVGTDTPATYQDRRITAHAAAAALYHWGRVPVGADGETAAQTAARVVFATHDTTTGRALASQYEVSVPDDNTSYQSYLFAKADQPQPAGFTSAGLDASNSWNAAEDITVGGIAYKAYILKALFAATHAEDNGRIWGIRTA